MSVWSAQSKFVGTAATLAAYYKEEADVGVSKALSYYADGKDDIVFTNVGGKGAEHLVGLDLSRGLTREQHADLHNGRWNGEQLVKTGWAPVQARDEDGKPMYEINPQTGKQTKKKIYEMVPKTTRSGEVILDPLTGQPQMKRKMIESFIAGYDVTFAVDKSASELMIAYPDRVDDIRACLLEAVNLGMSEWVENHNRLVPDRNKPGYGAERCEIPDGLVWFAVLGGSARPTEESQEWVTDPHLHAHVFLSSMAYAGNGEWKKIDGQDLFLTAETRAQLVSTQFNRLLEERGIRISYSDPDRKGRVHSEVEGSNVQARDMFSTNSKKAWRIQLEFEREHGRPPSKPELESIRKQARGKKTKGAKEADEVGNLDQLAVWAKALDDHGIELGIDKPGAKIDQGSVNARLDILFERLERPEGVARDIGVAPIFGPEVVLPAVYRSAEGLGFDTAALAMIADTYISSRLVVVREAEDASARLFTTQTILGAEARIAENFEHMAARPVAGVDEATVMTVIRSQPNTLDFEQEAFVKAGCGTERVIHLMASAGSGKTASLKPIVQALRRSGGVNEVVIVSVSRKRARETGESVNADKSWSVEALKYAVANGWKAGPKSLVIFDEAVMASTFDEDAVLDAAKAGRYIGIGDQAQTSAIGAAGWLPVELEARPAYTLTHNYRQQDWRDRDAFQLLRQGDAHAALDSMAARGRIFAVDEPEDIVRLARDRYEHWREQGKRPEQIAIINTGSNVNLDSICRAIQRSRLDAGELGEFERFDVLEQSTGRRWQIFRNDLVIFNKGVYFNSPDQEPILNGTTGTVLRMMPDGSCRVQLDQDDRRTVTVRLSKEADVQPICPAYAASVAKLQGGEVDVAIVIPGNEGVASLNAGYSAVSRCKVSAEILLDRSTWNEHPVPTLAEAWSRLQEKTMASEYMALLAEDEQLREDLAEELDVDELDVSMTPDAVAPEKIAEARRALEGPSRGLGL